ncbi:MAG TPA: 30S ribosomal protein S20 [Candidatus Babeliales bacterium]|jgi:small subunit ribosomal protein S20|nr:30S ribosomal protein S20 [Candidatus Babeliales bacterium]
MPNIASAKKRARQTIVRNERNTARTTAVRTAIKKVLIALEGNDVDTAKLLLKDAESKIMRAKSKDVLHHNTAMRKISRLAKRVSKAARA